MGTQGDVPQESKEKASEETHPADTLILGLPASRIVRQFLLREPPICVPLLLSPNSLTQRCSTWMWIQAAWGARRNHQALSMGAGGILAPN